jgi:hypothetical protein
MDGYRTMTENAGSKISCRFLHFPQSEDICLKSAVFGKNPQAMITASNRWGMKRLHNSF